MTTKKRKSFGEQERFTVPYIQQEALAIVNAVRKDRSSREKAYKKALGKRVTQEDFIFALKYYKGFKQAEAYGQADQESEKRCRQRRQEEREERYRETAENG